MKRHLIINPLARGGRSRWAIARVLKEFSIRDPGFTHVFAGSFHSIKEASAFANRQGYDEIVAVGGDGTISAVLDGFFDHDGGRISTARLGVIHTGTSPDFCRSYGIPGQVPAAVDVIFRGHVRSIRAGRILFGDPADVNGTRSRIFACCANVGLGPDVADLSNRVRKYTGDFAGTLAALVWALYRSGARNISVKADDGDSHARKVLNISAGRTRYIASGIRFRENIPDGDDRFYMLTAGSPGLLRIPALLHGAYTGATTRAGILDLQYARTAQFRSEGPPVRVECDGDTAGWLPCTVCLARDPVELLAPRVMV